MFAQNLIWVNKKQSHFNFTLVYNIMIQLYITSRDSHAKLVWVALSID